MQIQGMSKLLSYQINKNNIVCSIECWFMTVNFVCILLLLFFYLVLALLCIFIIFILSLRVWDPKLLNPNLDDWPQLCPVFPPDHNFETQINKTMKPQVLHKVIS